MHSKQYIKLMNSSEWRRLRNEKLSANPLCERCEAKGYTVAARCVHHITPIESAPNDHEMRKLAFAMSNLQSLCFKCHSDIHAAERSHSKEKHQERQSERLQRFIDRVSKAEIGK